MIAPNLIVGSPAFGTPTIVSMHPAAMHKAFIRWREQLYNADHRGIPFELSLADWLGIWIGSGHYHQRGRHRGEFVMSRPGDKGPYSVDNVAMVPATANVVEAISHPCAPKTRAKIARKLKGNKNGLGHRHSAATRNKMRKAARARAQDPIWLADIRARNASPAVRRKNSEGVKAAWAWRRAQEASP